MPYVCCVPGCRGNYKDGPKVHAFKFPNNLDLCKKWVAAIPRVDFTPTKHNRVCELHFPRDKVIFSSTAHDSRTGQTITINLKIPKLAPDAVPTLFPNCSKYLSKDIKHSPSRDIKLEPIEDDSFTETVIDRKEESEIYKQTDCYESYDDFLTILNFFQSPLHWNKIVTNEKVTFFKLIESPGPVITYSVVINDTLQVETFLYGREIAVSVMKSSQTELKTPFLSNNINEIKNLLCEIDTCDEPDKSNLNEDNNSHILSHVSNIIDSLISENTEYKHSEKNNVLSFIREQLKLLISCKERYRYSNNTMIVASILRTVSLHAYNFLRHANIFILPPPKTITSVCGSLLTDSTVEEKQISLKYANNIYRFLTEKDKHVVLMFNEININPYLNDKGGNVGTAYNNISLAKSALVFTLTSIKSSFKEVVHISPFFKIDHELVFSLVKTVIIKLEEIGYKVFCIVSDNNVVNSRGMSYFATPSQLSIVYPHPVDKSRPLFYLFDSVHLLKCIKRNWLNAKLDQSFHYPDLETGIEKVADFHSLRELHRLKQDKLLKCGYSLSLKALFPTNLESENVALALQIFNPFIVQALIDFGSNIDKSKETAEFMNIILTWWKIVSVKTALKGERLNDEYQEPIMSSNIGDDQKTVFLEKMLDWLNYWNQSEFSNKLASETHIALSHTIYGLLEITKYCFNELRMNCILLGKFQTDDLEYRFGKYRQLASDHYHISVRQLYGSEKRLRIQSLLTLNSKTFGNIQIRNFCDAANESVDLSVEDNDISLFNPCFSIEERELDLKYDWPVITYLAGYCCYTALEKLQCNFCKDNLVYAEEMTVEDDYNLIKNLGEEKLLLPQEFSVQVVCLSYIIFNKIISEFEEDFSSVSNKRQFLIQFIFEYITVNGYLYNIPECTKHATADITKIIITSTLNILLKNYRFKTNNRLNKKGNKRIKLAAFNI